MFSSNNTARKGIQIIEGYLHNDDKHGADQPTVVASDWNGFYVEDTPLYDYIDSVADIDDVNDFDDLVDFIDRDPMDPAAAGMTRHDDIAVVVGYREASEAGTKMYLVHYVDSDRNVVDSALYFERPVMYDDPAEAVEEYHSTLADEADVHYVDVDGRHVFYGFATPRALTDFERIHGGDLSVIATIDGKVIPDFPTASAEDAAQTEGVWLYINDEWSGFDMDNSSAVNWTTYTTRNTTHGDLADRFGSDAKLLQAYDDLGVDEAVLVYHNDPEDFEVVEDGTIQIDAPEGTYYIGIVM